MSSSEIINLLQSLNEKYEKADTLNIFQHTIQALLLMDSHVRAGGYIQLIQNGYGEYIFENAWPEAFRYMGAHHLAQNIVDAKDIYTHHKEELEKELTLEEFTKLYNQYPQLDTLHNQYLDFIDEELNIIKTFIDIHPQYFTPA